VTVLPAWVGVAPGWRVELAAERGAGGIGFTVGDVTPPAGANADANACADAGSHPPPQPALAALAPGAVAPAPRAPWRADGAGPADPEVWAVKRSEAVLSEALARAPAMRHPPLWRDLQILQVGGRGLRGLDWTGVGVGQGSVWG
jgi:hypothetical protein